MPEALQIGRRISAQLRVWSFLHGLDPSLERPSTRYGSIPVDGPAQGANIMEHWDWMVRTYREQIGLTTRSSGLPLPETLKELELEELIPVVEKIRAERGLAAGQEDATPEPSWRRNPRAKRCTVLTNGTRTMAVDGQQQQTVSLEYYSWIATKLKGAGEQRHDRPGADRGRHDGARAARPALRRVAKFAELVYDRAEDRLKEYAALILNGQTIELAGGLGPAAGAGRPAAAAAGLQRRLTGT